MPTREEEFQAQEEETEPADDVEFGGVTAYRRSMKLTPKMIDRINERVDSQIEKSVERKLSEILERGLSNIRFSSGIDSTSIAALICGLVALISGMYSLQLSVAGNIAVAEALIWVVVTGIIGLAILLYVKATEQ